jgi:hypothetical protein
MNETAEVWGSVNQCHAPTAVHTDITARRTVTQTVKINMAFKSVRLYSTYTLVWQHFTGKFMGNLFLSYIL